MSAEIADSSEGAPGDFSGQQQLDAQIDRMTIVGEKRWEDVTLLLTCKGMRHIGVEYFFPTICSGREAGWRARAKLGIDVAKQNVANRELK